MKELGNEDIVFSHDPDILSVILEMEAYLGLRNKDIDKINYTELIEYIDQITLMLLSKLD